MRRIVAIGIVAVLAAALGACGGSDKALSKADYVTQAEAICKAGNDKVTAFSKQFGANPSLAEIKKAYTDQLLPIYASELDQLKALHPPKADKAAIDKMLGDLSDGTDQAKTAIAGAQTENDFAKLDEPAGLKKASAEAKAYGLDTCGEE
jgi:hypothetical protein